jgi:Rieske Fe-S protein
MKSPNRLTRREFLGCSTIAMGGIIGAGIAIPAVYYVVGQTTSSAQTEEWIRLGSASKVEIGVPTLFKTTILKQTGWIINETQLSVYVLTEDGRDYIALSNICTHLGCRVRWISEGNRFICPCHNASFDKEGEVIEGPPPRPLDRYEVKVEDDQLYIRGG